MPEEREEIVGPRPMHSAVTGALIGGASLLLLGLIDPDLSSSRDLGYDWSFLSWFYICGGALGGLFFSKSWPLQRTRFGAWCVIFVLALAIWSVALWPTELRSLGLPIAFSLVNASTYVFLYWKPIAKLE